MCHPYHNTLGIFEEACRRIHDHILHWGYQESRKVYISILKAADVAVSTAEHEFLRCIHVSFYELNMLL